MTTLNDLNLPSIFVPLVGLVFPAITMASLTLHVKKKKDFLGSKSHLFFSTLR